MLARRLFLGLVGAAPLAPALAAVAEPSTSWATPSSEYLDRDIGSIPLGVLPHVARMQARHQFDKDRFSRGASGYGDAYPEIRSYSVSYRRNKALRDNMAARHHNHLMVKAVNVLGFREFYG